MSDLISRSKEEWKTINGYGGCYQISNYGNVKSIDRIVHGTSDYFQKGIVLKKSNNKRYDFVRLSYSGESKIHYIHELVATYFVDNPNNYTCINHKDENKTNNYYENLEWCTQKYNANYGSRNKRIAEKLSTKVARIKDGKIDKIYNSQADAQKDGFLQSQISKCCNGILKTHRGYEWIFITDDGVQKKIKVVE